MWIHSLFLLSSFIYSSSSAQQLLCHDQESSSLLQFKDSIVITDMDGCLPSTLISSWNHGAKSKDCCSWGGVECDQDTGHVIGLHLSSSCLYGSINSTNTLFRLVHLTTLNLAFNYFNFSGIPTEIRNFSRLTYLNLSSSEFSGQIPSEILGLSELVLLDLSDNPLKLQNPSLKDVGEKLTNLVKLNLNGVNISSTVPQSFTNLSSLSTLGLRDCNLQGEFPTGIFQLPNLSSLVLRHNPELTGYLPEFQFYRPIELLRLENTSFSGQLPKSIGNLKLLNNFVAKGCNFSGPLPPSIGSLDRLKFLDLSRNKFSGIIPSSIANLHKLTYLSLSFNNFSPGTLYWVGNLTELNYLSLMKTNLYGEIPSWLGNFTQLTSIELGSNSLNGSIPESLFGIPNLQVLVLFSNHLIGSLNSDLFLKKTSLSVLQLSDNNLSLMYNYDPSLNVTDLPKFENLGLSSCNLSEFPFFLRGQNELEILDLSHNKIAGYVPQWVSDLATDNLKILNLDSNLLTGFEQSSIVLPWTNLLVLNLTANKFQGSLPIPLPSIFVYIASNNNFSREIPEAFCNLTSILTLDLSNNKLSGTLPQCFGSLANFVSALDLRSNNLSGEIPDGFVSACALRMMDLSGNELEGTIPRSLANCSKLESLHLGENQMTDFFPHWLGVLPDLKVLILRSNSLFGEMGKQETIFQFPKLQILDLSYNDLTGKLPSEYFNNWIAMKSVDHNTTLKYMQADISFQALGLSWSNHFSYAITIINKGSRLSYERIQEIFSAINLSGNKFEGEIPEVIGSLTQLQLLNLSNNILTGHIPSSLGNLKNLEALDLSLNKLSGEIPIQLGQLNFLSSFNVSDNNLRGLIPKGNQFNTFENDSFSGNSGLCGNPLSKRCESRPLQPQSTNEDSHNEFEFGWKAVIIGYACGFVISVVIGWRINTKKYQQWHTKFFGRCLK
ncbi:receptor-like protein 7 [Euphorbia lathyris]|uniref:receptor-like protein 7 n=1 Tax=Euphorbia lathyris TaxID=212925 RepID=UPI003314445B